MIGKKGEVSVNNSAPGDVKAILGKGSEFEGKLRFEGTVRIDGKFSGEIHSDGTLIVGEAAIIDGDLNVDSAIISGKVTGNIRAKSRVEMHSPAKLSGNLQTPVLAIQEGVTFDGNCQMTKDAKKTVEGSKSAWGGGSEKAAVMDKARGEAEKKSG